MKSQIYYKSTLLLIISYLISTHLLTKSTEAPIDFKFLSDYAEIETNLRYFHKFSQYGFDLNFYWISKGRICGWRDSNSQGQGHTPLKRARIPIPPHPRAHWIIITFFS